MELRTFCHLRWRRITPCLRIFGRECGKSRKEGKNKMEKRMSKNLKIVLVTIILVGVALIAALLATYAFYKPFSPLRPIPPPPNGNPGDLQVFYVAEAVVSTLNMALLIILLVTSADIFRKTRSKFTFGLLILAGAFLVNVLASNPLVIWAFGYHQEGLGPFALLPDLFELIVLCVLLYLSFE